MQYHGYHSAQPSLPREDLPSQHFAIALVTAAINRQAAIILSTATQFWLSRVPALGSYRLLVTKNSPQSKSLSPRNLGDGYATVAAALDRRPADETQRPGFQPVAQGYQPTIQDSPRDPAK